MTWTGHPRTSSAPHRHWRAQVLALHPWCQCSGCKRCSTNGCTRASTEADHIINVANGGPELDVNNGTGLCSQCHAIKSSREGNQTRWATPRTRPPEPHPGLTR